MIKHAIHLGVVLRLMCAVKKYYKNSNGEFNALKMSYNVT